MWNYFELVILVKEFQFDQHSHTAENKVTQDVNSSKSKFEKIEVFLNN